MPTDFRVGCGYDVHRLVVGRKLFLGGINIPSERGLEGHSDADVLLHAVMDALLGAAGLPDIGQHFPNTDQRYSGISSGLLLARVLQLLRDAGFEHIVNIDCTVIAEEPKLATHIPAMRAAIASVLHLDSDRISIKATTHERLGSLGRGEGIAAQAVALIARNG